MSCAQHHDTDLHLYDRAGRRLERWLDTLLATLGSLEFSLTSLGGRSSGSSSGHSPLALALGSELGTAKMSSEPS